MPDQNGVPRWVQEKFNALDDKHEDVMRAIGKVDERVDKLADKQDKTNSELMKLVGLSAGIGAFSGLLLTMILKLIGAR